MSGSTNTAVAACIETMAGLMRLCSNAQQGKLQEEGLSLQEHLQKEIRAMGVLTDIPRDEGQSLIEAVRSYRLWRELPGLTLFETTMYTETGPIIVENDDTNWISWNAGSEPMREAVNRIIPQGPFDANATSHRRFRRPKALIVTVAAAVEAADDEMSERKLETECELSVGAFEAGGRGNRFVPNAFEQQYVLMGLITIPRSVSQVDADATAISIEIRREWLQWGPRCPTLPADCEAIMLFAAFEDLELACLDKAGPLTKEEVNPLAQRMLRRITASARPSTKRKREQVGGTDSPAEATQSKGQTTPSPPRPPAQLPLISSRPLNEIQGALFQRGGAPSAAVPMQASRGRDVNNIVPQTEERHVGSGAPPNAPKGPKEMQKRNRRLYN